MTINTLLEREWYIAVNGQSTRFRIKKYAVLVVSIGAFYVWRGMTATLFLLGGLFIFAAALHFFFRFKTEGWTKAWGPYRGPLFPKE